MRQLILAIVASLVLIGCSKDGAGNRLANGGQITLTEPKPTDTNMPEPAPEPAPELE